MTVIKNQKSNTYEVRTYYKDWTGVRKQKTKRGFKRKCDAQEWERAFKLKENLSLDMYFEDFCIGLQEKGSRTGSRRINGT